MEKDSKTYLALPSISQMATAVERRRIVRRNKGRHVESGQWMGKEGWDTPHFGERLRWAMWDYGGERKDKKIPRLPVARILGNKTASSVSMAFKYKDPVRWSSQQIADLAKFLDVDQLWLQYGPPHTPWGHRKMSEEMKRLHAELAIMDSSQAFSPADTERLSELMKAFDLGRKHRP